MTLWPEIEKVFGHGYEACYLPSAPSSRYTTDPSFITLDQLKQSITVSISNSRKLMATACRATTAKHAVVRLYDTEKFHSVGEPLEGHALTVTRIAFSPDDRHVLTVSRDRTWRLFRVKEDGVGTNLISKEHGDVGAHAIFPLLDRMRSRRCGQVAYPYHLGLFVVSPRRYICNSFA